jgi:ribosomal-protein-alanine N-acetyltransferase
MYASRCAKSRLWLEVRSRNTQAVRFYKALGMKIVGKIPNYYGDDDALIMVLSQRE